MGPIRILGIAPYQGIASLMDTVCADRENVEIDTFVGDMAAGLQIAQQRLADPGADYDVILSRGGTAELIRQNTDLPVIDIPLSVYDILRTIKLAENYEFSYAIIGFPAITRNAAFVCDVLRYTVEIHTIHDLAEARGVLARLRDKDCRLLLCDVVTTSLAQEYGIPTILFTSGLESVGEALDEAVQQALHQRQIRTQEDFFCQTLQALPHDTLVLRPDGTALVSAVHDPLPDAVYKRAAALALSVLSTLAASLRALRSTLALPQGVGDALCAGCCAVCGALGFERLVGRCYPLLGCACAALLLALCIRLLTDRRKRPRAPGAESESGPFQSRLDRV